MVIAALDDRGANIDWASAKWALPHKKESTVNCLILAASLPNFAAGVVTASALILGCESV